MPLPQLNEVFDVSVEEFLADPYPVYHRLRSEAPVFWDQPTRSWVLTRYADVSASLRDPRFHTPKTFTVNDTRATDFNRVGGDWLIYKDPPEHTRLRAVVNKAFQPLLVDQLRPRIELVTDQLLDRVRDAGHVELMAELAFPLPVTIISQLVGLPAEYYQRFQEWSHDLATALQPRDLISGTPLAQGRQPALALDGYFRQLVESKRRHPSDDLISSLIFAQDKGDGVSTPELVATCILMLFAGAETTTNLIGNAILALLRHPEQLALLRGSSDLMETAVEEFLRYDSVQFVNRVVAEDVSLDGQTLRKGSEVYLFLAAANRDPQRFTNPDRLEITRPDNHHLAFGGGIHYCLGAPLARLEAKIAISRLLRRFPRLKLATDEVEWKPRVSFRGLKSLPLTF